MLNDLLDQTTALAVAGGLPVCGVVFGFQWILVEGFNFFLLAEE